MDGGNDKTVNSGAMASEGRPMTFGEKAVGLTFNPEGNSEVAAIKQKFAAAIDIVNDLREEAKKDNNSEMIRMYSVSITELQSAQMWAVKAVTWKY